MALPPGPRQPAIAQTTRWLRSHIDLLEDCRRRYGDAFTLRFAGVGELVFVSDPDSARRLFTADRDNSLPAGRSLLLEPVLGPRSLILLEGDEHMRRRRLMLPPFHGERMRAYEETIAAAARAEIARWPRDREFPLREGMQAITLEVILTAVFGVVAGPRRDRLRDLLSRVLAQTRRSFSQVIGILTRPLGRRGPYGPFQRLLDETDALLADEIAERRRDPGLAEREDILSMLVAARFDDGSELGDAELRDQLMTLLVAGHETTATALSWAFDLLLHDPPALERARSAALGGDSAHLDAVATEAQRIRPVITSVGRRLGAGGTYAGHELPAGTSMMVSTYLLHTRPDLYPDPYEFRPERFTEGRAETYSWLPFGGGIRRCIGAAFAQLEMRVVLREVLAEVELRPASPRAEQAILSGITLVPRNHVRVLAA